MIVADDDKNKKMLRDYSIRLVAGVPQSLNVEGKSYYVLEAGGTVVVRIDDGVEVERIVGQGAVVDFKKITFSSSQDMWIRVTLGTGYFVDNSGFFEDSDSANTYERTKTISILPNSRYRFSYDISSWGLPDRPRLKDVVILADVDNAGEVDIFRNRFELNGVYMSGDNVPVDGEIVSSDGDDHGDLGSRGYRLYPRERVKYSANELWLMFWNYNDVEVSLHLTMRFFGKRLFMSGT